MKGVFPLKKKLVIIMLMVFAMPLFSSALPQAEAAGWENKLAEVVTENATAAQLEELLKMRETLNPKDKQVLWGALAKTAIERTGKADMVNNLTALSQQLSAQDQAAAKVTIVKAVETAVRSKVDEKVKEVVTGRLAGYQDEFDLLSTLLNSSSTLTPAAVQNNNSLAGAPQNYSKLINMTATAYGPGPIDNGKWNDLTYAGGKVKKGIVAVDPAVIPMGTKLWVEGYGQAIADDQGSAIKGNRIDLAFNSRQEALDYGIQNVKVYVLK
jgi:3D (Asp-Asp-Asp) domain-containing protein